jgi:hypothetical protein
VRAAQLLVATEAQQEGGGWTSHLYEGKQRCTGNL